MAIALLNNKYYAFWSDGGVSSCGKEKHLQNLTARQYGKYKGSVQYGSIMIDNYTLADVHRTIDTEFFSIEN